VAGVFDIGGGATGRCAAPGGGGAFTGELALLSAGICNICVLLRCVTDVAIGGAGGAGGAGGRLRDWDSVILFSTWVGKKLDRQLISCGIAANSRIDQLYTNSLINITLFYTG
jgi:hypothetical protein